MNSLELLRALQVYHDEGGKPVKYALTDIPRTFNTMSLDEKMKYKKQVIMNLMSITGIKEYDYIDKVCKLVPDELISQLFYLYSRIEVRYIDVADYAYHGVIDEKYPRVDFVLELINAKARCFLLCTLLLAVYSEANGKKLVDEYGVIERILKSNMKSSWRTKVYVADVEKDDLPLYWFELEKCLKRYYDSVKKGNEDVKKNYFISPKGLDLLTIILHGESNSPKHMIKLMSSVILNDINTGKLYPSACLEKIYDTYLSKSDFAKKYMNCFAESGYSTSKSKLSDKNGQLKTLLSFIKSYVLQYGKLPTSSELSVVIEKENAMHGGQRCYPSIALVPFYPCKNPDYELKEHNYMPFAIDYVPLGSAIKKIRDAKKKYRQEYGKHEKKPLSPLEINSLKKQYGTDETMLVPLPYCLRLDNYSYVSLFSISLVDAFGIIDELVQKGDSYGRKKL